jgi:hypothetical protein
MAKSKMDLSQDGQLPMPAPPTIILLQESFQTLLLYRSISTRELHRSLKSTVKQSGSYLVKKNKILRSLRMHESMSHYWEYILWKVGK